MKNKTEDFLEQLQQKLVSLTSGCDDCWMMCSARDEIMKNKLKVLFGLV